MDVMRDMGGTPGSTDERAAGAEATPSGRRAPLDRDTIVATGVLLADRAGVKALSMRNLAGELGYKVMSLYNHVSSKDELLGLMVEAVAGEIEQPDPATPPLMAVRRIAVSTRAALERHPWATEVWLRAVPGPNRVRQMEDLLRALDHSGLRPDLAHHGFHAVTNHVLGYTLNQQGMAIDLDDPEELEMRARQFLAGLDASASPYTIAHVNQHLDGDSASSFELVLDLILDGLVRLNDEPPGR